MTRKNSKKNTKPKEWEALPFEKNQDLTVTIDALGSEGEGIAHVDGYTFFVKEALPGDEAVIRVMKLKKNYGYARLMEVLKKSSYRVEPRCEVARQCGGCQLQHLSYDEQLRYKENKVKDCFKRIAHFGEEIDTITEPIIGMETPYHYRNKAQFPVGKGENGQIVTGFYASRSHAIVDCEHCYIQAENNDELLALVKQFITEEGIEPYDEENHTGLVRHILTRIGFVTGEIMVCLVINGTKLPHAEHLVDKLKDIPGMTSIGINCNTEKTNVILGPTCHTLWGQDYITDYIGDIKYQISPLSFFQVNPVQTKKLYETALEYADLTGNEIVWDLYCGIGTISLFLAKQAKQVYGVEIVPEAIADAKNNAKINEIHNAEFFVGAAEEVMPAQYEQSGGSMRADVVVVDPPRKGCDETLLQTVIQMQPKRVVYVSCDPATLARDCRYLCDQGYEMKRIRAVDQFSHSMHVETVVLLSKIHE
ncbi:23S rRNA (uracil(1939)-C(5))-methyltransferase RlmD [Anaerosporobacter faecicola]|uniref:23S rRNA (uracil(1939)-C(5))-methyltransferase RlmD n=1 Tax=Anaerosporobacter faecicola TaxID=2718714 RepID=UPI00143BB796|nr:23S rRNA (uracil(1939)-C(5))-methyltransferase RlmD [Anaerosporobacter faecicola]